MEKVSPAGAKRLGYASETPPVVTPVDGKGISQGVHTNYSQVS